jgi:hypothetical protein
MRVFLGLWVRPMADALIENPILNGRQEVRRRVDGERRPRGERHVEPWPAPPRSQDGHGIGKTAVIAMLIAWQALNQLANPQDARFSDAFRIVSPGITICGRLRVLLPNDPNN